MLVKRSPLLLAVLSLAISGSVAAQDQTPPANQTPPPSQSTEPGVVPIPAGTTPSPEVAAGAGSTARKAAQEEIIVTGSRVRRKDLTTAAPVSVITRQQISSSGIASIGDFLQQMPEQTGSLNSNVNNGGDGETQINLRNLGANRTLVLVDGKRWVNGGSGAGTAVDLNSIPTAAIERIEILKDGASAVYGSDAVAGVVNIITRRRPNGTELSAYGGLSPHGDAQQYDLSLTTGVASDKGSFLFSAGYFRQESMFAGNRDWATRALTYDYSNSSINPGGSGTVPAGRARLDPSKCPTKLCQDLAAAYGAGKKTFINDPNTKDPGADPVVDGWRKYVSSGPTNDLYNYQAVNFLITPSTRISLFSNGDYRIADFARAYVQASFVNRQSSYLIAPEPLVIGSYGITIAADNPYNPFKTDITDARRRLVELNGRSNAFDLDTVRAVVGIDGSLPPETGPLEGLFYDLSFNYGRTSGVTTTGGSLNTNSIATGLGSPTGTTVNGSPQCGTASVSASCVNLFSGQGPITPDMATALGSIKGINNGFTQIAILQANVSKELFNLASDHPVGLAVGYEHRREYGGNSPNPIAVAGLDTDFNGQPTLGSYNVNEGYAELDIPVINNVLGADDLEVQLAVRAFNYSTFGSDTTYKLGARWRPIRDITFRGTYSTAFRAPNVSDLYLGQGPSAEVATDPCAGIPNATTGNLDPIPAGSALGKQCTAGPGGASSLNNGDTSTQINSTVGGNPKLTPETAKIGTVGVVFEPTFSKNFSMTVDYWRVDLTKDIGIITTPIILAGCYPAVNGSSAPPNQDYCNLIQRSATTGQLNNVNDLNQNVGSLTTSGIDLSARYIVPTDYGRFAFLFDSVYLVKYDLTLAGGKLINAAGNYDTGSGVPTGGLTPKLKFNAGVNYSNAGFSGGVSARYIGGFDECAGADGSNLSAGLCSDNNGFAPHRVKAYGTFDAFVSYLLRNPAGNTTFGVGVRNFTDQRPPVVYNSFLTYADPQYDFAGRYVYGRITHQF